MNFHDLCRRWMASYRSNPNHALRDAERNLKGFTSNFRYALQRCTVDYAFESAIRRTLRQQGVR